MKYKFLFIPVGILILSSFVAINIDDWKLEKNKDNIRVYTRSIEDSDVKEFLAVSETSASAESLLAIHRDVPHYVDWLADMNKVELIKKVNKNNIYVYYELNIPWPMDDRDMILHVVTEERADKSVKITLTSVPDMVPVKDGLVRMRIANGYWLFLPKNDKISIKYQFMGDPAGSVPAWITNMFVVDGPHTTMLNLINLAEKK